MSGVHCLTERLEETLVDLFTGKARVEMFGLEKHRNSMLAADTDTKATYKWND